MVAQEDLIVVFFVLFCVVNFSFSIRDVRWYNGCLSNVNSCNSFWWAQSCCRTGLVSCFIYNWKYL